MLGATIQNSSPPSVVRKRLCVLRAWQPAAAMPAAQKDASRCRVPIYLVECGFIQHVTCGEESST